MEAEMEGLKGNNRLGLLHGLAKCGCLIGLICVPVKAQSPTYHPMHTKMQASWMQGTNVIYDLNGQSSKVASLSALFKPETSTPLVFTGVVFMNPSSGEVWAGLQKDYYIETGVIKSG